MFSVTNPTFVCRAGHRFKSDTHSLTINRQLRLAECPTCRAELAVCAELSVEDLISGLIAMTDDTQDPPVFVPGLVAVAEHPADAQRREWREFLSRIEVRDTAADGCRTGPA